MKELVALCRPPGLSNHITSVTDLDDGSSGRRSAVALREPVQPYHQTQRNAAICGTRRIAVSIVVGV